MFVLLSNALLVSFCFFRGVSILRSAVIVHFFVEGLWSEVKNCVKDIFPKTKFFNPCGDRWTNSTNTYKVIWFYRVFFMENMLLLSFLYHQSVSDRCSRLEKNRNFEICSWLHSPFYCKMKLKAFGVLLDLMNLKQNNLKINGKIFSFSM